MDPFLGEIILFGGNAAPTADDAGTKPKYPQVPLGWRIVSL